MNTGWSSSGRKVSLYLTNGEVVVGWVLFEDGRKLIVAVDCERENVRLVDRRLIQAMDVDANREHWIEPVVGRQRLEHLERFEDVAGEQVRDSFDRLDVQRLRRLALIYYLRDSSRGAPILDRLQGARGDGEGGSWRGGRPGCRAMPPWRGVA